MALSTRSTSRQTIGVTRARQGKLGRNVLWILTITLLLVVLGFFATWTWKANDLANVQLSRETRQANAEHFNAPKPSATARQNDTTTAP